MTAGGTVADPPRIPLVRGVYTDDSFLAGLEVRVLTVGGHTPGSIAVHLPTAAAVLTGDIARTDDHGRAALGLFHTSPATARAALATLAALGPDVAGVGHGTPLDRGAAAALREAAHAADVPHDQPSIPSTGAPS